MKKAFKYYVLLGIVVLTMSNTTQAFIFGNKDEKLCEETYLSGDIELAEVSCNKAAPKSAKSQYYLGNIYLKTDRVPEGIALLEEAASSKQPQAALVLGEHYEALKDDESNIKALFYYGFACDAEVLKACERVHIIQTRQKQIADDKKKKKAEEQERLETERKIELSKAKLAKERKEHEERIARERELIEIQKQQNEAERAALELRRQSMSHHNSTSSGSNTNGASSYATTFGTGIRPIGSLSKYQQGTLWGYVDSEYNWIIKPRFRYAAGFYENLAAVQLPSGYWGFINPNGQLVIDTQFCAVARFSEGLAGANLNGRIAADGTCKGGTWGYINKSGEFQIPPVFEWIGRFNKGVADVKYQGSSFKINKNGDIVSY